MWDPAKLDALGRPKPKQVRVFWDLDNIYPDDGQSETVSSFLKPLKTFANTIGDCRSIIAFSNHIPSKSGLDELTSRKSIPEYSQDKHISGWDRCSKRFRQGAAVDACRIADTRLYVTGADCVVSRARP